MDRVDGESARLLREKNRRRLGNLMDLDIQLSHTRVFPFKSGNGMRAKRFYLVSWLSTQSDGNLLVIIGNFLRQTFQRISQCRFK